MTTDGIFDVAGEMERLQQAARDQALVAIGEMRDIAERYAQRPIADKLVEALQNLENDEFRVIIMGRFNHGKSTLLNALLAETTHPVDLEGRKGPMATGNLPTTAILTGIHYSEKLYVAARRYEEGYEEWTFSRYLNEAKLDRDGLRQQAERLNEIREFAVGYPAKICSPGIVICDSPGLDENDHRSKLTEDELVRSDAAVMLFSTTALLGRNEAEMAMQILDTDTQVFYVVNIFDNNDDDEPLSRSDLERYMWNRFVHDRLGGPPYTEGARLADRNIYLVNAMQALNGRIRGDNRAVAESGILEFERVLLTFLADDMASTHIGKHARTAVAASDKLRGQLKDRAHDAAREQTSAKERYQSLEPKIKDLRARPAILHRTIDVAEVDLRREMTNSLQVLIFNTRDGLGEHMTSVDLPTEAKTMTAVFYRERLKEEAADAATKYVTDCVSSWADKDGELGRMLRRTSQKLTDELQVQAEFIESMIADVKQELGFRSPTPVAGSSALARTVGGVVGGIVLGPIGAIAGSTLSGRAVAGGLAGAAATGALLGAAGLTGVVFAPAVIGVAIVAALFSGGHRLGDRVKAKIVTATEPTFATLQQRLQKLIDETVDESFGELRNRVDREVVGHIESEIRNIQDTIELTQRSEVEKAREIAAIKDDVTALGGLCRQLEDAVSKARMGGVIARSAVDVRY